MSTDVSSLFDLTACDENDRSPERRKTSLLTPDLFDETTVDEISDTDDEFSFFSSPGWSPVFDSSRLLSNVQSTDLSFDSSAAIRPTTRGLKTSIDPKGGVQPAPDRRPNAGVVRRGDLIFLSSDDEEQTATNSNLIRSKSRFKFHNGRRLSTLQRDESPKPASADPWVASSRSNPSNKRTLKRKHPVRVKSAMHRQKNRRTEAHSSHAIFESDSDVELLSISDSVGDITLANIEQLEADEVLARQLQSVYDREMEPPNEVRAQLPSIRPSPTARRTDDRRGGFTGADWELFTNPALLNSNSHALPPRRHLRYLHSDNQPIASRTRRRAANNRATSEVEAVLTGGDYSMNEDVDAWAESSFIPPRISSGRPRQFQHQPNRRTPGFIPDSFLQDFFLGTDPFIDGPIPARSARNRNFRTLHSNLFEAINLSTESQINFEAILNVAERLGDAQVGLKKVEIDALTTGKMFVAHEDEEKDLCSICMAEYETGEYLAILPCVHNFHKNCVNRWLQTKPTCPICRVDIRS